jgi:predicted HicB family RNase H-like nuclease
MRMPEPNSVSLACKPAAARGISLNDFVNALLKKDIELIEAAE